MSTRKTAPKEILKETKEELVKRVLEAGRENGSYAIMFQQSVGQMLGLNATDMKCLDVIYRAGPASPTQLSELTGLTTGAVTILIDRLEKAKLIERKPDPEDRRRTILVPTKQALKKVPPFYQGLAASMVRLASGFTESELKTLERYFQGAMVIFKQETEKLRRGSSES